MNSKFLLFSVFRKISDIQIHTKCEFGLHSKLITSSICVQQLVPYTIHGTQLYRKTQIIHHVKTVHGTHEHYSSFKNYFITVFSVISFQFS